MSSKRLDLKTTHVFPIVYSWSGAKLAMKDLLKFHNLQVRQCIACARILKMLHFVFKNLPLIEFVTAFSPWQAAAIHAADPKALVTVGRCEFVLPFRNRFLCLNHNLMALTGREVNMILFILRQLVATCKHRCTAQQYRRPRTKVLQLLQRRVFS